MRAFAVYRAMLIEDKSLRKEINALDEKINEVFRYMLDKIDALHQDKATPRRKIGYKDYQNE
jgi:phage-related protein